MATWPNSLQKNSHPTELINGDGDFNESGFEDFIRGAAASIPVIAIVGPQSSGKSTLLNHLFRTNFREMNAQTGRSKTTNGIWIAKAPHTEPLTVVLDLEGTDGKEKGEDDTAFEKQSALFAIAIAHTVIINMWWSDVGREHAANRPLLKTVFEAMLSLSLYSLEKTTLHFVVRDGNNKTGTPSELLKRNLKEDIEKIWEAVPKPPGNEGTLLTDIFNVDVTVLSNYLFMRQDFDDQVVQLQKQLISHNLDPSTSKLSLSSAKKTWDTIKEFKGFKAPPYRLMFATTRCDEIAVEKLKLFQANQAWLELEENAKTQLVKDFGARTNSILTTYLFEYDNETINFESGTKGGYDQQVHEVRSNKRQDLTVKALKVVYPAYMNTLGHLRSETLRSFTTQLKARIQNFSLSAFESYQSCYDSCMLQFDQQCADYATVEHAQWKGDALSVRKQLLREIREHALNQIRDDLSISVTMEVFRVVRDVSVTDKWESIRRFMETAKLAGAGIFGGENEEIVADLEKHVRDRVVNIFKDESLNVEELIKHRFILALTPMDDNTMPTKEEAYRQCLDMLSTMAVIRLDDTYDVVQRVLRSELLMNANSGDGISLSSVTWENVPLQMTLITPLRCKQIWTNFKQKTEDCYSIAEKYEEVVHPDCTNTLGHIRSEVFRSFMTKLKARGQKFSLSAFQTCRDSCLLKFDKKCSVDATIEQDDAASVRKQLLRQMNEHALCQLRNDLSCSIITKVSKVILRDCSVEDIWDCIRLFLKSENERAKSAAVGIFGTEHKQIVSDLEQYARISVVTSVKLLFRNVEKHLKERFIDAISTSSKTMDKKEGHRQCLALLSTMAVIRLDDTYDVVHRVLNSEFLGSNRGAGTSSYPHSSHTWENVPQEMTLITPLQCEDIWTKFTQDMEHCLAIADAVVNQHQKKQDEKQDEKRPLRKWVVFGIAILGFYEFMAILICNPPAAVLFFVEVALQQGVLRKLKNKLIYSDTKEEFEKDDISKQSRFIKFLWSYMEKIYRIFRDKVLGNTFRQIYIN